MVHFKVLASACMTEILTPCFDMHSVKNKTPDFPSFEVVLKENGDQEPVPRGSFNYLSV